MIYDGSNPLYILPPDIAQFEVHRVILASAVMLLLEEKTSTKEQKETNIIAILEILQYISDGLLQMLEGPNN